MIITISGKPGSGKSSVARELASKLGLAHVSAGDFMREMAAERDITVLELSAIAEEDDGAIDREIDSRTRRFGEEKDDFVIDARLAWYFIPRSVKVFLDVSIEMAAARIYGDRRVRETENVDLLATQAAVEERLKSESDRYRRYYGIDWLDRTHYDLVIDTSPLSIGEVVAEILEYLGTRR